MRAEPVAGACGKGGEGGDMSNFDIPFTPAELTAAGVVTYPAKTLKKQFSFAVNLRTMAATVPPEYDFVLPGFLVGTVVRGFVTDLRCETVTDFTV